MTTRSLRLLEKCKNLNQLKIAHGLIIASGLGSNSFALSRILAFCSNPPHGALSYAQKIFNRINEPTICICNTMIKAFLLKYENFKAIEVYKLILKCGLSPDNYTLPYALKACEKIRSLYLGGSVHGHAVKMGLVFHNFVGNNLIVMYSVFDDMGSSKRAFDEISTRCVVSWTVLISGYAKKGEVYLARLVFDEAQVKDRGIWGAMISGYVQNSCSKEGLQLFRLMQLSGITPDEACFVSVLCACAHLGSLEIGKWVHRYVKKMEMTISVKLGTSLIDMYAKCGCLELAEKVFDEMLHRDVICWNTMISGYAINGNGKKALELFDEMRKLRIRPDEITFLSLFTACSYSDKAQEGLSLLQMMCDVYKIEPQGEHYGCIIDLLSRGRLIEEASSIVERMPASGSAAVAWRALLSGCCSYGDIDLAEAAAERVVKLECHSGAYVLLSNAYAASGRYSEARQVRKVMRRRGVEKVPGCSSVEINGVVHEFIAGDSDINEVCGILKGIKKQFDDTPYGVCDLTY